MAFDTLIPQPSINMLADAYGSAALDLSRLAAMGIDVTFDIAYGDGQWRRLDIYLPHERSKDLPVLMNFHGGGFTAGYKEWMGLNAPPILAIPAIYISVGYTLGTRNTIDVAIDDGLTALAWVRANIASYGGSPDRIFIGGHSAGAMLTALMTLRKDLYPKYKLPETVVKACFPVSGTFDLVDGEIYGQETSVDTSVTDAEAGRAVSALSFVAGNTTPFFVTWGANDSELLKTTTAAFVYALRQQPGGRAEAHMFPQLDHFWMHIDQMIDSHLWNRTIKAWMGGDPRTTPLPPVNV